jgi:hypothetical protein
MKYVASVVLSVFISMAKAEKTFSSSSVIKVKSDLSYLTSNCEAFSRLEERDLVGVLFSHDLFSGKIYFTLEQQEQDRKKNECLLHLNVDGSFILPSDSKFENVFDVIEAINEEMPKFVKKNLRGITSEPMKLISVNVKLGNKNYTISMSSSSSSPNDINSTSQITYSGNCDQVISENDSQDILQQLFPDVIFDVGNLAVETEGLVNSLPEGCAVAVAIDGSVLPDVNDEYPLGLLKAFDQNLDSFIDQSQEHNTEITPVRLHSANLQLNVKPMIMETRSDISHLNSRAVNAPTKAITLGILCGITVLCSMLFVVNYKRRALDRKCQQRYENASRAAQIRRVSIRMQHDRSRRMDEEEEEEEKEEERHLL